MIGQDQSTSMDIEYTTTGIQPEVSFIMQMMEEDADKSSTSSDEDGSGEYTGKLRVAKQSILFDI
jgi:predicted transcriptional regulator